MRLAHIMVILVLMSVGTGGPARAARADLISQEERIASCIHVSARGQVWLERTLWGLRDQEAGWIGAAVLNINGSYDLGPMQVNSWWVPKLAALLNKRNEQIAAWLRDDPCFNVEVARWIFLSSLEHAKDFWTAVGLYHSPNQQLRVSYERGVWIRYRRRFAPNSIPARSAARSKSVLIGINSK